MSFGRQALRHTDTHARVHTHTHPLHHRVQAQPSEPEQKPREQLSPCLTEAMPKQQHQLEWACATCTFMNAPASHTCSVCGSVRARTKGPTVALADTGGSSEDGRDVRDSDSDDGVAFGVAMSLAPKHSNCTDDAEGGAKAVTKPSECAVGGAIAETRVGRSHAQHDDSKGGAGCVESPSALSPSHSNAEVLPAISVAPASSTTGNPPHESALQVPHVRETILSRRRRAVDVIHPKFHACVCALSQLSPDLRGLVDAGALTVQQARAMMMPSDTVRVCVGVDV